MEFVEKDTFYQCQFSRMYVYELWKAAPGLATERIRHVSQLLLQMLPWGAENLVDENLCSRVAHLCKKLTEYWKKANRTHKVMVDRYCDWLNIVETVNLSKTTAPSASSTSQAIPDQEDCNNSTSKLGRPRKDFKECSKRTKRRRLVELTQIDDSAVSSYKLPASVHKVLIHGSEAIDHVLVSIGELSEEAAESTNKNIKAFRLSNTRKMSRVLTNTDLLNRLLLNSDPFITGLRKLPKKKKTVLSKTVISLLDF